MSRLKLPKVDKTMIVAVGSITVNGQIIPIEVRFSPRMQIFWQTSAIQNEDGSELAADKVTKLNTSLYPATAISNPPTQAQVQAIADALHNVALALQQ